MYAVIAAGGRQHRVEPGQTLFIEKLEVAEESEVVFNEVLALGAEDGTLRVGTPFVSGSVVRAKVIKNGKAKKIIVFTYKPKKGQARKLGHRQPYTKVEITAIEG